VVDSLLREFRRLIVAEAQEVSVDDRCEERILEEDGTECNAEENQNLGICNDAHSGVIVRFDPRLNPLEERMLVCRLSCRRRGRWREEMGQEVRAQERQDMEERKYRKRDECDRYGLGDPPEQGEEHIMDILVRHCSSRQFSSGLRTLEQRFVANDSITQDRSDVSRFIIVQLSGAS